MTIAPLLFADRQVTTIEPLPNTTAVDVSPNPTPTTIEFAVSQTIAPKQTNGPENTTDAGSAASSIQDTGVIWLIFVTVLLVYFSSC